MANKTSTFQIAQHDDNTPILYADTDEAFRQGCAVMAANKAVHLLSMLKREHGRDGFDDVFVESITRAIELMDQVRAEDSEVIANVVFGEYWLVGKLVDGEVVPNLDACDASA